MAGPAFGLSLTMEGAAGTLRTLVQHPLHGVHCMTRSLAVLALTAAALTVALPASAQTAPSPFAKPEDAVKYRKAAFTLMGAHFGRIGAMAQGRVPFDGTAAAANADLVVALSKLPYAG